MWARAAAVAVAVLAIGLLPWSDNPLYRLAGAGGDGPEPRFDVPLDPGALQGKRIGYLPASFTGSPSYGQADGTMEAVTARFADIEAAGATLAPEGAHRAWEADVVVKVQPPTLEEAARLRDGAALVSLIYPARHPELVDHLAAKRVTVVALDRVPRITRAQSMDVLSSMANLAGYRGVLEAAAVYQGFFGSQVTAAGTLPPARVLVHQGRHVGRPSLLTVDIPATGGIIVSGGAVPIDE